MQRNRRSLYGGNTHCSGGRFSFKCFEARRSVSRLMLDAPLQVVAAGIAPAQISPYVVCTSGRFRTELNPLSSFRPVYFGVFCNLTAGAPQRKTPGFAPQFGRTTFVRESPNCYIGVLFFAELETARVPSPSSRGKARG